MTDFEAEHDKEVEVECFVETDEARDRIDLKG